MRTAPSSSCTERLGRGEDHTSSAHQSFSSGGLRIPKPWALDIGPLTLNSKPVNPKRINHEPMNDAPHATVGRIVLRLCKALRRVPTLSTCASTASSTFLQALMGSKTWCACCVFHHLIPVIQMRVHLTVLRVHAYVCTYERACVHAQWVYVSFLAYFCLRARAEQYLIDVQIFLDLSDNDLVRVPVKDLCQVSSLRSLVTLGNPRLFSPPLGVAERGGEANMAYLREAQATGHFNTSVQMFMLGPTESGKTSLVTALLSEGGVCPAPKYGEDIATIGIEEVDWRPLGVGDMEVRIKDMSGQSVYAVTNQRFLVQRALYVITWRLLAESRTPFGVNADIRQTIETWMEYVHVKVPGAYCMLVATHKDSVGLLEADNQCKWAKEVVHAKVMPCSSTHREMLLGLTDVTYAWMHDV